MIFDIFAFILPASQIQAAIRHTLRLHYERYISRLSLFSSNERHETEYRDTVWDRELLQFFTEAAGTEPGWGQAQPYEAFSLRGKVAFM
jgi:hypothetical protein